MRKNNRDSKEIKIIETQKNKIQNLNLAKGNKMNTIEFMKEKMKPILDKTKPIRYYVATLKGGHVKPNKYITFFYYIKANNLKQASEICNTVPRAKKNSYGFLIDLTEITYNEYLYGLEQNRKDQYLLCSNPQEQRLIYDEISDRIFDEPESTDNKIVKLDHIDRKMSRRKNQKKYLNRYLAPNYDYDYDHIS